MSLTINGDVRGNVYTITCDEDGCDAVFEHRYARDIMHALDTARDAGWGGIEREEAMSVVCEIAVSLTGTYLSATVQT